MAINRLLRGFVFTIVLLTVLASEEAANERKATANNDKGLPIDDATAKNEVRNGTTASLDYSISVTMVNYGLSKVKVQQRYLFPDGVEVKTFTLQKDGYRSKRSTDNQRLTQWVGGTVDLKPSDQKKADLTYTNHPSQIVNPNSKTFHKLSTMITVKEGDLLGGKISSPNYPLSYPNGADLTWLIIYPPDNIVKLEMEDYAIEECCDRLIVYDGYNKSHYPLATFEGYYSYGSSNNVVLSTQPAMLIRFTSDCLVTARGFRASYINQPKSKSPTTSCGYAQQFNGNEGYIQSPDYPNTYDEYMNCSWSVETYYNTRVRFVFTNFTIGYDDYVAIYEGTPSNPGRRLASLNYNVYNGYTVYASTNEAFVLFTSGYETDYADRFIISYNGESNYPQTTASAPMSCGYVHYTGGNTGYIMSPNFPGTYDDNMNCTWSVQTSYNTRVIFNIDYFYIGSDDQVTFREGTPNYPGSYLRTLSGSYGNGYHIYSSSNQAFLQFTSGYNTNYNNKFNISYYGDYTGPAATTESYNDQYTNASALYYDPPQCSSSVSLSQRYSGHLYSPGYNYPEYYPVNDYCVWYITTYSSYDAITFYSYYFSIEYNYDWVRIYNGHGTYSGNQIRQVTGYVYPYTTLAVSNSRYATLTFTSDNVISDRGFDIYYYGTYHNDYATTAPTETTSSPAENSTCPYPYVGGAYGQIESPYYPYAYHNNMNCTQWVNTPYGTLVRLTVRSFSIGSGDYFNIYNGYTGEFLKSMSNYFSPGYQWQAPTNYIRTVFTSDSFSSSSSYIFDYEGYYDSPSLYTTPMPTIEDCGGPMPFNYGVITSPYYPQYINDLHCIWTVDVSSNMNVLFTVVTFNTESCCDHLYFYGGTPSNPSGPLESLSGFVNPGYEIKIPDNQAWVSFNTDYSVTSLGFNITYQPVPTYYVPHNQTTSDGNETVTQGYATQWMRSGIQVENGPKTLGKDLWGDKEKPAHLRRREKLKEKDDAKDTLN